MVSAGAGAGYSTGRHSGSAVRVAVDSTGHRAGWPAEPIVELPAVDSTGHRRQPAAEPIGAGSTGHRSTYCPTLSEEPKKPESGTEADSTGRLLAAEPPEHGSPAVDSTDHREETADMAGSTGRLRPVATPVRPRPETASDSMDRRSRRQLP